jgi:hypothetical protein
MRKRSLMRRKKKNDRGADAVASAGSPTEAELS